MRKNVILLHNESQASAGRNKKVCAGVLSSAFESQASPVGIQKLGADASKNLLHKNINKFYTHYAASVL